MRNKLEPKIDFPKHSPANLIFSVVFSGFIPIITLYFVHTKFVENLLFIWGAAFIIFLIGITLYLRYSPRYRRFKDEIQNFMFQKYGAALTKKDLYLLSLRRSSGQVTVGFDWHPSRSFKSCPILVAKYPAPAFDELEYPRVVLDIDGDGTPHLRFYYGGTKYNGGRAGAEVPA